MNAMAQTFMSLGVAYGCLIAFASYNRFHSPFIRDGLCLSALNSIISLVAGIIVFAALGHTALVHGMPLRLAASDSITFSYSFHWQGLRNFIVFFYTGLGFSLVMYATVVAELPFPQFWAVLFFLVFIFLGLDTQVSSSHIKIKLNSTDLTLFFVFTVCNGGSSTYDNAAIHQTMFQ